MKKKKHLLSVLLAFVMVLSLLAPLNVSAATVKLDRTKITLAIKQTTTLKLTGTTKKPTWSSSNTKVATVSSTGLVTAKKKGTATITAKLGSKKYTALIMVRGDYKALYKAFLEKDRYSPWYFLIDFNKDGLPELVTFYSTGGMGGYSIYTIFKEKVVSSGNAGTKGMNGSAPVIKFSTKYRGIICEGWTNGIGGVWSTMWNMSGTKLVNTRYMMESNNPNPAYHTGKTSASSKTVSKASYQSFYNKYFKSYKTLKMLANNSSNRTKSFGK